MLMYCPQCGYRLTLGNEKFCPSCGTSLDGQRKGTETTSERSTGSVGVADTKGDILGAGISGSSNIIGKEIGRGGYTLQGNIINLSFSDNTSKEFIIENLQKIITAPTQIDQSKLSTVSNADYNKDEFKESEKTQQQIKSILEEVDKIEKKEGTQIQEIRAEDIQISKNDLSIKDDLLQGNEYFYKKAYSEAIKCYDKAIELDPIML
jgi:Tetratricopeptide repeat/zinc-ribbon domain